MMTIRMRSLLIAGSLLAAAATAAFAQQPPQPQAEVIAPPVLRANVTVTGDIVRVGDILDNAGPAGTIAIYRAPDLGTVGTLPIAQVIAVLRAHHVIGVDTRNLPSITVTRLSRSIDSKDIENQIALALEHRNGLGNAADLSLTFDQDVQNLQLDASYTGALQPTSTRFDSRSGRFDVTLVVDSNGSGPATKLRFTGTAIDTVEVAVLARAVDRNEVLKSSDIVVERRPRAEVGNDGVSRDRSVGMQSRRQLRAGQALRSADLVKPDLVVRDQAVTLIYQSAGLYLTIRGKAVDGGTEGDVVNVLNLQSKRTVTGVVVGRGQVAVSAPTPRPMPQAGEPALPPPVATQPERLSQARPNTANAAISLAANDNVPVSRNAE